jgi:hypothetical protein
MYQYREEEAIGRLAQEKSRNKRVFVALLRQPDAAAAAFDKNVLFCWKATQFIPWPA